MALLSAIAAKRDAVTLIFSRSGSTTRSRKRQAPSSIAVLYPFDIPEFHEVLGTELLSVYFFPISYPPDFATVRAVRGACAIHRTTA